MTYLLVVAHFPLLGVFSYLRAEKMAVLGYLIYVVPMLLYIMLIWLNALLKEDVRLPNYVTCKENRQHSLFLAGMMLIVIVGLLVAAVSGAREPRYAFAEAIIMFSLAMFWVLVIKVAQGQHDGLRRILSAVIMSLTIYILMNVISVVLGFHSSGHENLYMRQFEAIFSPLGVRVNFPFSSSGQFIAITGGILVIFSTYWLGRFRSSVVGLGMMGLGILVLLGQSARGPILALVLIMVYWLIMRRMGRSLIMPLVIFILFVTVAFVYLDAGYYLQQGLSMLGVNITRTGGDVASLSNRSVIWGVALRHMLNEAGVGHVLFGYGAYGQISSGISGRYQQLFEYSYAKPESMPLHSSYVQAFVDFGFLGLFFLVGVLWIAYRHLGQLALRQCAASQISVLLTYVLFYLSICAVTEAVISYYSLDLFALFLFINIYIMAQFYSASRVNKSVVIGGT